MTDASPAAAVSRSALAGLLAFALAAIVIGGMAGAAVSGASRPTAVVVGAVAAALGGALGGLGGAWQARAAGLNGARSLLAATAGPVAGALLLLGADPQASLATLAGLAAVATGALAAAFAALSR
jgi:hypothetical protein